MDPATIDQIGAARAGNRAALEGLIQTWHTTLLAAALRLLSYHPHEAEEAVQETWLSVCRNISSLQDTAGWRAWIYTILRNSCLKRREALARERQHSLAETTFSPSSNSLLPDPEPIRTALKEIPPAYGEAITLKYLQDLTYREIAEVLGVHEGTVKSNVHKGLLALEKRLRMTENLP